MNTLLITQFQSRSFDTYLVGAHELRRAHVPPLTNVLATDGHVRGASPLSVAAALETSAGSNSVFSRSTSRGSCAYLKKRGEEEKKKRW